MPGLPGNDSKYDKKNRCPHYDSDLEYDDDGNLKGSRCNDCGKYDNYDRDTQPQYPTWDSD